MHAHTHTCTHTHIHTYPKAVYQHACFYTTEYTVLLYYGLLCELEYTKLNHRFQQLGSGIMNKELWWVLALLSQTSSWKKALCSYKCIWEKYILGKKNNLQTWQFNQNSSALPHKWERALKAVLFGTNIISRNENARSRLLILGSKLRCHTEWACEVIRGVSPRAVTVFPCKERRLVGWVRKEGAEGVGGRSSTWITVCTLDVSKSQARSL